MHVNIQTEALLAFYKYIRFCAFYLFACWCI